VRVRDSTIAGQNASTEERLNALQQRLIGMEHKIAAGLAAIDAKVEERLMNLENRVEQRLAMFEANAELRFDTLEAVMRQLVAQTAALPSLYGQVVKEQMRNSMPTIPTSPRWFS
jgi:flagellar capping protein FliD